MIRVFLSHSICAAQLELNECFGCVDGRCQCDNGEKWRRGSGSARPAQIELYTFCEFWIVTRVSVQRTNWFRQQNKHDTMDFRYFALDIWSHTITNDKQSTLPLVSHHTKNECKSVCVCVLVVMSLSDGHNKYLCNSYSIYVWFTVSACFLFELL